VSGTSGSAVVRDHDFHPPDDVRVFPMPMSGVLRLDDDVFVAEVRYGDIVVRHHAFREHWFKINCTTDREGRFVETTAPEDIPPVTFNCDIATPMLRRDDAVYAVDLWLDVLVGSDGVTYGVHDQDEFEAALQRGWLSKREAAAAQSGLRELLDLIEARRLVGFLGDIHPFGPTSAPQAPDMGHVQLSEVESILAPAVRPSW
jgi:hypothetical protein